MKKLLAALMLTLALASVAKAVPTVIGSTTAPNGFDVAPASFTWTAADNSNGNSFSSTGCEILLVNNTDAAAQTVTATSVPDQVGRTGDSTKLINATSYYVFQKFPVLGWKQSDGTIHLTASSANIKYAVIRLPNCN